MSADFLWQSPQFLKGIGPRRVAQLAERGVADVYDLMYLLPRGYRDMRLVTRLCDAPPGVEASFRVRVSKAPFRVRGRRFWRASVADDSGTAELFWFSGVLPGPARELQVGDELWILGRRDPKSLLPAFAHPRLYFGHERIEVDPLYRGMPWLSAPMRRAVAAAAPRLDEADPLEAATRRRLGLSGWGEAFTEVHAPPREAPAEQLDAIFQTRSAGYRRLAADMFLTFFLGMGIRRRALRAVAAPVVVADPARVAQAVASLPFSLTGDQQRALDEILRDMARPAPMFRLVQGDVGSGKTAVAMVAAAAAASNGGQVALLAPTEILAAQHARSFDRVLAGMGLRIGLMTGSMTATRRQELLWQLRTGNLDIAVGTHALLTEGVAFRDLRLVVVDEEQRYGVDQRGALREKGEAPHTLLLSATPIPRSLALALLGETDVSVIREKPAGRAAVTTALVPPAAKRGVLDHIRRELDAGHRVFFLYPRVEGDEDDEAAAHKSVIDMHARLAEFFGRERVGLLHGRLPGDEKDRTLRALQEGRIQILVSTSVIEVGVDVPEATILVIGHPEVFGLSQLHQIRGRIGRGTLPGTCYLLTEDDLPEESLQRLTVLTHTSDGFEIAEADLELRGPGSLVGTRQSGMPDVDPVLLRRFRDLAETMRHEAAAILAADPHLKHDGHRVWREVLARKWGLPAEEIDGL